MDSRRLACVWIADGSCVDAIAGGRVRLERGRAGGVVIRVPAGHRDASTASGGRRDKEPRDPWDDIAAHASRASIEDRAQEIHLGRRSVSLSSAAHFTSAVIHPQGGLAISGKEVRDLEVMPGSALVLSETPFVDPSGASPLSAERIRQMVTARAAHQLARQFAGLLLGSNPEAEGLLIVYAPSRAVGRGMALAACALMAVALSLRSLLAWGAARPTPDHGVAVLLTGEAAGAQSSGRASIGRLEGIEPGTPLVTVNRSTFGFSSSEAASGLEQLRLYTSEAARVEFRQIDLDAEGESGQEGPVLIAPSDGVMLLLRSAGGRQACFTSGESSLCSTRAEELSALGVECLDSRCTWTCLAGTCLADSDRGSMTLLPPSAWSPDGGTAQPLSRAAFAFWDALCLGCLDAR